MTDRQEGYQPTQHADQGKPPSGGTGGTTPNRATELAAAIAAAMINEWADKNLVAEIERLMEENKQLRGLCGAIATDMVYKAPEQWGRLHPSVGGEAACRRAYGGMMMSKAIGPHNETLNQIADILGISQLARGWRLYVPWDACPYVEVEELLDATNFQDKTITKRFQLVEMSTEDAERGEDNTLPGMAADGTDLRDFGDL